MQYNEYGQPEALILKVSIPEQKAATFAVRCTVYGVDIDETYTHSENGRVFYKIQGVDDKVRIALKECNYQDQVVRIVKRHRIHRPEYM